MPTSLPSFHSRFPTCECCQWLPRKRPTGECKRAAYHARHLNYNILKYRLFDSRGIVKKEENHSAPERPSGQVGCSVCMLQHESTPAVCDDVKKVEHT